MRIARRNPTALRREIAELRNQVDELTTQRDRLLRNVASAERVTNWLHAPEGEDGEEPNIYVLDDDDAEARAFDDFYRAYDDGHAKTRKFLLG